MKTDRPSPPHAPTRNEAATLDARKIDELYGLEPVLETGESAGDEGPSRFVAIECPYCGEPLETQVDLSAGSADYIEDCQVCCRPMQMQLEVGEDGRLVALTVERTD